MFVLKLHMACIRVHYWVFLWICFLFVSRRTMYTQIFRMRQWEMRLCDQDYLATCSWFKASCSNDRRVLDDFHLVFIDLYALHVIFLHFPVIWTTCFWTNEVWLLCTSRNEENGNRRNLFVLKFSTKFICNIHLGFYATIYDNKKLSHWSASKQNTEELQKSLMLLTCFGGFSK